MLFPHRLLKSPLLSTLRRLTPVCHKQLSVTHRYSQSHRGFRMNVVIPAPDELKVVSRRQYDPKESISPSSVSPNPFEQFRTWLTEVRDAVLEPEAMSLSTATSSGIPSSRFVLFKRLDKRGFVFYTNYTSRKSRELESNPHAALAFYWKEVSRQVRVVGRVEKVSRAESEEYFRTRPVGSRLGAWASEQSKVVGEDEVRSRLEEMKTKFGVVDGNTSDADIPLPEFWGGWRVVPEYVLHVLCIAYSHVTHDFIDCSEIEFWSGKPSRLHDRICYLRVEGSTDDEPRWSIDRLAP